MNRDNFVHIAHESGTSLHSLALQLEISDSTMSRKIKQDSFTIAEAKKICEALGVSDPRNLFFT